MYDTLRADKCGGKADLEPMTLNLRDELHRGLLGDGPILDELIRRGLKPAAAAETANLDLADAVREIHGAFAVAGATLLCTNTRAAHAIGLAGVGLSGRVREVNERAVELCRRGAADSRAGVAVAGQIGPTGRYLALNEINESQALDVFGEQIECLDRAGVDILLFARFSDLEELLLALRAASQVSRLPMIAAILFDAGADRLLTSGGVDAATAAERLVRAGADVLGCDCAAPENALVLVKQLVGAADRPVFVRTNAGLPEFEQGRVAWSEDAAAFASRAAALRAAGASVVAGCCGITVAHVAALRAALETV